MNILKTILDFILSMSHLFFRKKKKEWKFCEKCGALVGRDGACRSCPGADGGGAGGSRGDHGGGATSSTEPESKEAAGYTEEMTTRLVGWAMIGVAVLKMIFIT